VSIGPLALTHTKRIGGCVEAPRIGRPVQRLAFKFQGRWVVESNGDISAPGDGELEMWLASRQLQDGSGDKDWKDSWTKACLYREGG
jgi:hypothetical protein